MNIKHFGFDFEEYSSDNQLTEEDRMLLQEAHNASELARLATSVVWLDAGQVISTGSPELLQRAPPVL